MHSPSIQLPAELRIAISNAETATEALRQAGLVERALKLEEHIQNARRLRFSIGVVALAKRGKSTLINGLLGRKDDTLAPIDRMPATNVVSCFAYDTEKSARVLFRTDDAKSKGKPILEEEIKEYACEEYNPGNRKGVKIIEVLGPFTSLGKNVVLVDTPGADNALSTMHDIVLLEFLPKLDAVVFLVTADAPFVESELALLNQIRKNDVRKLLFAINKIDKVDSEELQQGQEHNLRVLAETGFGDSTTFKISAKLFYQTGADSGTESLIRAVEEIITNGRASVIAERLTALTESHVDEAGKEISALIENSEMTSEEIVRKCSQLDEIRRNLESSRDRMETSFRSSWNGAFDNFADALNSVQRQMVEEYTDLVESSPARTLDELGRTIHTDVIKRLDELLEPHLLQLSASLDGATRELQVQVLDAVGIPTREAEQLLSRQQCFFDSMSVPLSGAPALVGAVLVGTLPGLVGSAILSAAPAAVAIAWNPLTWLPAIGSGVIAGAASTTGAVVATVLAPIAIVGTPLLVGLAGLRILTAWKYQIAKKKNELAIGVKDLIVGAINETRENLRKARSKSDDVLVEFRDSTMTKIGDTRRQLGELEDSRPSPEQLVEFRHAKKIIEGVKAPKTLPNSAPAGGEEIERLFP